MTDVWPSRLLVPNAVRWTLAGAAMQGGRPVFGPPRLSSMTGGGYWTCQHSGVWVRMVEQLKVARALAGIADGGATSFLVASCELRQAPGAPPALPGGAFDDGAEFSDGAGIETSASCGVVVSAAALRATSIAITAYSGELSGGEAFSIDHPIKGPRRYTINRVTDVSGDVSTVTIRPPLREAVTGGEYIEFEKPRCLMTLANADEFKSALDLGRFCELNPLFVEAF